jgi:ribosomal protein S18 acetylase RimI-like enzyme
MISHYFLEVEVTNNSAIKLYEKSSFKIIHQKKHFYGTGRDAFVMTLEIAN